ncbi:MULTISPECIES: hypothetical protein [unclassified Campylobacter]|uniref:hypothetical protein n=1 Tax=unclassified Campylobacter TaxID=2593542 RepID=UPI0014735FFA|nr:MULTISPECIES: hypothetical protein [unclassified Campylobacter]
MREFSKQERARLMDINSRLYGLEKRILDVAIKTDSYLAPLKDRDEIYDYDIDLKTFYKDISDSDKVVVSYNEYFEGISQDILKEDSPNNYFYTKNQNEFQHWEHHPMKNEWHCRFYHCLYDHTNLYFEDILDIGNIDSVLQTGIDYSYRTIELKRFDSRMDFWLMDCSDEEKAEMMKINSVLQDIQETLISKAILYENELKQKLKDGIINGFDMNYEVTFYLNEKDPLYKDDEDNVVAIINEPLNMSKEIKQPTFQNRWRRNCNEYLGLSAFKKLNKDYHCYLFHALCNHTSLLGDISWMSSIGKIILTIKFNEYFEA